MIFNTAIINITPYPLMIYYYYAVSWRYLTFYGNDRSQFLPYWYSNQKCCSETHVNKFVKKLALRPLDTTCDLKNLI